MNGTDLSQLFNFDKFVVGSAFGPLQILLSLSITFLMAMFVYYIYKKTYTGVLYSKNFNLTLVMTALTVNAIIIGISGNIILSLGMVGALSIVRFRTAVKDPKDTAFIFWALTIGVINGVGYYELSLISSLFIAAVMVILSRTASYETSYMLIIKYADDVYTKIEASLKKDFQQYFIRSDSRKGDLTEKVIEVKLKNNNAEPALQTLRSTKGVESCVLLASNGEFAE